MTLAVPYQSPLLRCCQNIISKDSLLGRRRHVSDKVEQLVGIEIGNAVSGLAGFEEVTLNLPLRPEPLGSVNHSLRLPALANTIDNIPYGQCTAWDRDDQGRKRNRINDPAFGFGQGRHWRGPYVDAILIAKGCNQHLSGAAGIGASEHETKFSHHALPISRATQCCGCVSQSAQPSRCDQAYGMPRRCGQAPPAP